ncbi:MAG: hypothetical protein LQ338_006842 [Usnochroma carphineum]|nr:MAG: hypothetical protein LQ338_006842 [Usnochroma carphineum]
MLQRKGTDKARHYLNLLDTARCGGEWSEIPELVRKVSKHAPQRRCLQITAQAEYQEATGSTALSQPVERLTSVLREAVHHPEDAFQARICLGSLHWALNEPALALQTIPEDVREAYQELNRGEGIEFGWSSEKSNNIKEALRTYKSILPHIENTLKTAYSNPEYRVWTEKLLARYCILSNHIAKAGFDKEPGISSTNTELAPFRVWAEFWSRESKNQHTGVWTQPDKYPAVSRRRVWHVYFDTLSAILQSGASYYPPDSRPSTSAKETSADNVESLDNPRLQQSIELRRVEATYEGILLREESFPKANEANIEVESWADQVVANWRILLSPQWLNEDLGKGGKEAVTRNVLAILYRAATRTFHSTRILRHLFTVHTALAEFLLAGKAFDTYIELVSKGKARVEKSGESEVGLDDDATVLMATAAGIQMLCCYGQRKQVETAQGIAVILETWLEKMQSAKEPVARAEDNPSDLRNEHSHPNRHVPAEALAAAHYSLGICRASWARLTYETSSRPELQAKAIASFRAALDSKPSGTQGAEFQYALALVLAETRDIDAAIESIKRAIPLYATDGGGLYHEHQAPFDTQEEIQKKRGLFKAWHLLSFLLSARQDFATATASCDAANELYKDELESAERYQVWERLAFSERQCIIELKMSQLVLSETVSGPDEAVNAAGDLLSAYKRLFVPDGALDAQVPAIAVSSSKDTISPPQSANGTIRRARRSLLGRSKEALSSLPRVGHHSNHVPITGEVSPGLPGNTNSNFSSTFDGSSGERKYQPPHHLARQEGKKLHKRRSLNSMVSEHRTRDGSPQKASHANGSEESTQAPALRVANHKRSSMEASHNGSVLNHAPDGVGLAVSHIAPSNEEDGQEGPRGLPPTTSHSTHHKNLNPSPEYPKPPKSGLPKPSSMTSHSSCLLPDPLFSSADVNRRSLTLLARIWLLIARLYRDADLPVDAQGAISEAFHHAHSIEAAVAGVTSSAGALSTPGWGNLKSVAEVWADVHAEQAALHLQLGNPTGASEEFEKALGWFPDHNAATVGLSSMLLDYYDPEEPSVKSAMDSSMTSPKSRPVLASLPVSRLSEHEADQPSTLKSRASPSLLSRLAARDRAYGLLSMLTKSGTGWDNSEAWSALARVYEQSGQMDKAKEALWWVVELEDSRPLREWSCIGGF